MLLLIIIGVILVCVYIEYQLMENIYLYDLSDLQMHFFRGFLYMRLKKDSFYPSEMTSTSIFGYKTPVQ